jgi:hypothetical protein
VEPLEIFKEEKSLLPLSRIKAIFCSYTDGKVATVWNVLVIASKETGLEVNADKTRYIIKCRDQNAGRNDNIKTGNNIVFPKEWKISNILAQT